MKYLIVNGDDFGASRGINRGILEAHRVGILTSTSLMVDMLRSEEAVALLRGAPDLSVGLHACMDGEAGGPASLLVTENGCRAELHRQLRRFEELMGRLPTHVDSHHHVHRDPRLLPRFLELAARCGCPLREYSSVRCVLSFYGQWGGETRREQIGVEGLVRLLQTEVRDGVTELCCHPGYVDVEVRSSYSTEREIELRTLCDPALRESLEQRGIRLIGFRDLPGLPTGGRMS